MNLIETSKELHGVTLAAKNIRIELKAAFPSVKFAVKTHKYSGGNSIDINYIDGPAATEIEKIINKYKQGHFDPMNDLYEYKSNEFNDKYGSSMYIFVHRQMLKKLVLLAAEMSGYNVQEDQIDNEGRLNLNDYNTERFIYNYASTMSIAEDNKIEIR